VSLAAAKELPLLPRLHGRMAISVAGEARFVAVVAHGEDIVDILGGWDGGGRHDEGQNGGEIRKLNFGLF
jgi:hypothetical protein